MSSFVSSRRQFVTGISGRTSGRVSGRISGRTAVGGALSEVSGYAVIALFVGMALMAVGLSANVTAVFAVGSMAFIGSILYLNSMAWAKLMDKADYRPEQTHFDGYHF